MKKDLGLIMVVLSCTLQTVFAQEEKTPHSLGFTLGFRIYNKVYASDNYVGSQSYQANASPDFRLLYRAWFKSGRSIQTELAYEVQTTDMFLQKANINAKVYEDFINVPFIYYRKDKPEDHVAGDVTFRYGIGVYGSVLITQKYHTLATDVLPTDYRQRSGFGSYIKFGTVLDLPVVFYQKNASVTIGYRIHSDLPVAIEINDVNSTFAYINYGLYLAYRQR